MRQISPLILAAATTVTAACARHTPPVSAPSASASSTHVGQPCGGPRDVVGEYALAFTMQGSPVDMVLRVLRDSTGTLSASTRSMGTRVDARRVTVTGCSLHVDLDPTVAGEGQIDLTLAGDAVAGTLTWQGQPTPIAGRRAP